MLREAENKVKIEGILAENDLKYVSYQRNGVPMEAVGGTIKVLVEREVNGVPTTYEVPVAMFSNKYIKNGDKAGQINPAYTNIEEVMNNYKSIAATGSKDLADKIRLSAARIKMNEFYGRDGKLIATPRVNASFVNRVIGEFKPEANFVVEMVLSEVKRVCDVDGVEVTPTKLELTGIIPIYGGKVDVIKFYTSNPNAVSYIETNWETGHSYRCSGRLNFTSETRTVREEVDFGEPIEKSRTISLQELVITSGAAIDENFEFDISDIKDAMAARNIYLEELKKPTQRSAPPQNTGKGKLDLGF